jgi:hypothetical protein
VSLLFRDDALRCMLGAPPLQHVVSMPSPAQSLLDQLARALEPAAHAWLTQALAEGSRLGERLRLRTLFTQAARKLGRAADVPSPDAAFFAQPAEGTPSHASTSLDLARAALLLATLEVLPADAHVDLLEELYRTGEQREQQSILRALVRLPDPARFTSLAINACRTNSTAVFGAIACDNHFPAAHFPELHFNQLVLKSIFIGVSVARIIDLERRANVELRRMLEAYASERRAAGRVVPDDVRYALAQTER